MSKDNDKASDILLVLLLDRSGSMSTCKTDIEGGFRTLLADQRKVPGTCKVSLHQFDTEYETVYEDTDVADAPDLVLVPRGMTALLDGVGRTIEATDALVKDDDRQVVMVIMTDGFENASREFSRDRVKELITARRADGWQFMFLGADQDAVTAGAEMGVPADMSVAYASAASGSTMGAVSGYVTRNRTAVTPDWSSGMNQAERSATQR